MRYVTGVGVEVGDFGLSVHLLKIITQEGNGKHKPCVKCLWDTNMNFTSMACKNPSGYINDDLLNGRSFPP